MKHYFEYNSSISSIDLAQAIASPIAPGPFAGFASANIIDISGSGSILKVNSKPTKSMEGICNYLESIDKVLRRNISKLNTEGLGVSSSYVNFGCIARDGSIHTSEEETLELSIQGTKRTLNEVFLFAEHIPVTEPVANPLTFIAIWNESNISFYDLYRSSIYPEDNINISYIDPVNNNKLTYDYLNGQLKAASNTYATNENSLVFIGAYGTGTNPDNYSEPFALVPYFGKFPIELTYNTYIHRALFNAISTLQRITQYVTPVLGVVELWAGKVIPPTYRLCDGTELEISEYPDLYEVIGDTYNTTPGPDGQPHTTTPGKFRLPDLSGRFIVGYRDTDTEYNSFGKAGGSKEVTLSEGQLPNHSHRYGFEIKGSFGGLNSPEDASGAFTPTGSTTRGTSNVHFNNWELFDNVKWNFYQKIDSWTSNIGSSQPHPNRPPYYVLAYIMKVKF